MLRMKTGVWKVCWGGSGARVSERDVEDRDGDVRRWIPCSECFRQACLEGMECDKLLGTLVRVFVPMFKVYYGIRRSMFREMRSRLIGSRVRNV